jgi:DnaJ domain
MDPYSTLGVPKDCTLKEVKEAFRGMALHMHPDHGGSDQSFVRLCAAYKQIIEELDRRPNPGIGKPPRPPRNNRNSKPPIANWDPELVIRPKPADPNWDPDVVIYDVEPRRGRSPEPSDPTMVRKTYLDWLRQVSSCTSCT